MSLTKEQIGLYTHSWQGKPVAQIAEEIASLSMETNKIPDPYSFIYSSDGKLVSPETGKPVEDSIDKISPLGQLEFEGFKLIEKLGWENETGTILWISPPHPLRSKPNESKVVVINVSGNSRKLFNRAFMLDMDEEGCKKLANKLELDYVYTNASQLRRRPIYISETLDFSIIPDERQVRMVIEGSDLKAKKEALKWGRVVAKDLSRLVVIQEEQRVFGNFDPSCPPTAFQVFAGEDEYGSLQFECPNEKCKRTITRERGKLVSHCPYCEEDVRCG